MWQPWNGLEIWDPEQWEMSVDESVFVTPPTHCTKSWHKWTIKCDDDGYPVTDDAKGMSDILDLFLQ